MMHKQTFQFRLYPTPAQESALVHILDECRWLYNHFLEERKVAWEENKTSIGLYDQINRLPALKAERPALGDVHSQVLQNVAMRIDLAFKAFFRRVQEGEEPGYPRFRGPGRYDSFCYPGSGYKVDSKWVYLSKIGRIKAIVHRAVEGAIKTCCVKRTSTGKWYVTFNCVVEDAPLPVRESAVGIDVGLESFATLSDGSAIANPRFFRTDEKVLRKASRRLAKAVKGTSARRKRRKVLARIHERIANRRRDFAHQEVRKIVNNHGIICVEDLSINQMVHNHCLAKSIADAAWRMFTAAMTYKAAWAGRRVVAVNPAYTSQDCSRCGHRQRMPLAERIYTCPCCHLVLPRDLNAALNILRVGLHSLGIQSLEAHVL